MTHDRPAVLATYVRSGFTEGHHYGHAVVVDPSGAVIRSWGDPGHQIFPRSSNKPVQAMAMVRHGLDVPDELRALAASSHSGEDFHLAGVRALLSGAGLSEDALQTPSDLPLDPVERDGWLAAGRAPRPIAMNCSGKHAAMLHTCVVNGWSLADYRDAAHPLQVAIREQLESMAGERVAHVGVDGCGAPVLSVSLAGLARSLSSGAQASPGTPGRLVVDAMIRHPEWVGGTRRDVTAFMRAVPGLVAKDGAEGVYVAALPDGTAVAVKIDDGSDRARQVVLAAILGSLGGWGPDLERLATIPVHGGGLVVGRISATI